MADSKKSIIGKIKDKFIDSLSVILFFTVWELGPRLGFLKSTFVSPPSEIFLYYIKLITEGNLISHIGISLFRSVIGFFLAIIVGVPLGFLLGGWFKTFEKLVEPVLKFLGQFNPFSLFPIFILILGIGEASKIAMIFWVCLWPVIFNTTTGVKELDPLLIKAGRAMGLDKLKMLIKIVLPGATPYILNGFKLASSTAFFMLIAAEMMGASRGLGWLVWNAQVNYQIPKLYAGTGLISALGLTIDRLFKLCEKRILVWKQQAVS
ncbi:MAG TPA: ABC transporter permease [Acetivibrio clariflavus]|nr:ABC transporter permease [Acetivibrio clariflavus]